MMKICLLCSHNVENDDDDKDDKEGENNNDGKDDKQGDNNNDDKDDKEGDNNNSDVCRKNLGDLIPRHMQIFKANEFFCGLRSR